MGVDGVAPFEALITTARLSVNVNDFALIAMLGVRGGGRQFAAARRAGLAAVVQKLGIGTISLDARLRAAGPCTSPRPAAEVLDRWAQHRDVLIAGLPCWLPEHGETLVTSNPAASVLRATSATVSRSHHHSLGGEQVPPRRAAVKPPGAGLANV